jgi:hypothetical protein
VLQGPYFDDVLDLIVPHEAQALSLQIHARGWSDGLFIKGARYKHPPDDPFKGLQPVLEAPVDTDVRHLEVTFSEAVCLGETKTHTLEVKRCSSLCASTLAIAGWLPLTQG